MNSLFDMLEPASIEKEEKKKAPLKKEKKQKETKQEKQDDTKVYKYPFTVHISAQNIDVSHIFEEGQSYTADQITKMMLEHGFYNFSGNVTYDFIESDNVLVPIFQYHKKG